jgi:putative CocE/NonD family hydrolase
VFDGPTDTIRRGSFNGSVRFVRQPVRRIAAIFHCVSEQRVLVELDVPAPMRDGVTLRANVYRPPEGRWPVLLTRLPYGKDLPLGSAMLNPVQAVRRGYVVIVQDTRGRFSSEGEWRAFEKEDVDGVDTIAWAAALPYADGQVGMFGVSYFGFTQWAAAINQPPALKAIAPRITWADPLNGLAFRGGALELGTQAHWGLQMGFDQMVRQHQGNLPLLGQAFFGLTHEVDQLAATGYASLPLNDFAPLRRQPVLPRFFEQVQQPLDRQFLDPITIAEHRRLVRHFPGGHHCQLPGDARARPADKVADWPMDAPAIANAGG